MARIETIGSPLYLFRTVSGYRNKFSSRHLQIRKQSCQRTGLEHEQEKERNTSGRGATPKKKIPQYFGLGPALNLEPNFRYLSPGSWGGGGYVGS